MREISGGSSHASHNSAIAHFGLDQLNQVDSLEVVWTGGVNSQTLYDLSVNQRINVVEDTSSISTFTFEIFEDQEIVLSPNPVEDILNISLTTEVAQIRISTIDGILMDQFLPVGQKNISHKIDLPNGIYLVEFIGQRKRAVRKLIVQN